jgi:hypothetical protein
VHNFSKALRGFFSRNAKDGSTFGFEACSDARRKAGTTRNAIRKNNFMRGQALRLPLVG